MKLQPKKAISADLATQRKAQIDEGVKIATKVDVLRENLVEEQGKLQRFREETVAIVQADIDRYIGQKDSLRHEVAVLERQKSEAQIPLDAAWAKLHDSTSRFAKEKQAWGEKSELLKERQAQIEREEAEVENEKFRAADLKHRAAESLSLAESTLKEARESAAEIRNKAQVVLLATEAREAEVRIREEEVKKRSLELEAVSKRQQAKDIEQAQHDRTIKDKYATLERTIKRGKHG